jgi:protein translocase SecG subunit
MATFILVFHIIVSVLLMLAILSQQRSSGLSLTFGGNGSTFHTKRGPEKVLANITVVLAVLFVLTSLASLFIK